MNTRKPLQKRIEIVVVANDVAIVFAAHEGCAFLIMMKAECQQTILI
jgi:hypothetical protein